MLKLFDCLDMKLYFRPCRVMVCRDWCRIFFSVCPLIEARLFIVRKLDMISTFVFVFIGDNFGLYTSFSFVLVIRNQLFYRLHFSLWGCR